MSFSDQQNSYIIIEKLNLQKQAGYFCDVELVLQDEVFNAHRNVLAAHSEYFLSLFKKCSVVKERLIVDGCKNLNAFQCILNYMYTGFITIDWKIVVELLQLASLFRMENVKNYCEVFLRDHIEACNIYTVLRLAGKYSLLDLTKAASDFIKSNAAEILEKVELLALPLNKLKVILKDNYNLPQQSFLLPFLSKWIEFDADRRKSVLCHLLSLIDWNEINPTLLEEDIDRGALFGSNSKCLTVFRNFIRSRRLGDSTCEMFSSIDDSNNSSTMGEVNDNVTLSDEKVQATNITNVHTSKTNKEDIKSKSVESKRPRKAKSPKKAVVVSNEDSDESSFRTLHVTSVKKRKTREKRLKTVKNLLPNSRKRKNAQILSDEDENANNYCMYCSFRWRSFSDYSTHLVTHFENPPFSCNECSFKTNKIRSLCKHASTHRNKNLVECSSCEYSCKSQRDLQRHLKNKHGVGSKSTGTLRISSQATRNPSWKFKFKCDKCSYATNSEVKLKGHILYIHESDKTYKCRECDYTWKWHLDYDQHLKTHYPGPPYLCRQCNFVGKKIRNLSRHLPRHDTDRPFKCDVCEKAFKSHRQLEEHQLLHAKKDPALSAKNSETVIIDYKPRQLHGAAKCEKCSFASHSFELLSEHILSVHETDATYKCADCDFEWTWIHDYTTHLHTHYKTVPYRCNMCPFSTHALMNFANHLFRHSDKLQFECSRCGNSFKSLQQLNIHRRGCKMEIVGDLESQHFKSARKFKCAKCAFSSDSEEKLEHHAKNFHVEGVTYKCHNCDFLYENFGEYYMHLKLHYDSYPYKCKDCDYTTKRINVLAGHLSVHSDDHPFQCGTCGNAYKTPLSLQGHIATKHSALEFPCDKCGKKFSTEKKLTNHQLTHTNPKVFLCDICGWRSKSKDNLNSHRVIHNKVHKCEYPGCSYKTAYRRLILSHTLRHKGEFPYVCSSCGKRFTDPTVLKSHELHKCGKTPIRPRRRKKKVSSDEDSEGSIHETTTNRGTADVSANNPKGNRSCVSEFGIDYIVPESAQQIPPTDYFSFAVNHSAALPRTAAPSTSSGVPTISHELPTKLRSFMTFM